MSRTARNPLTDWLRQNLSNIEETGPCTSLSLIWEKGNLEEEVHTTKFQAGTQWKPEELAERFHNIALEHCKDDKGLEHRYKLIAYYGTETESKRIKRFNLTPWGQDLELLNDSPDAKGQIAQGMRLTEQIVQGTFRLLSQTIGGQAQETMHLRQKNMEMFEMMQNLMVKVTDSDHERTLKRMQYERETKEREMWFSFAPMLINTTLGKEVFPQASVDTKIVETVAESLSEEDIQLLASKLPPHLWGPLASRFEKHLKSKRLKEEEKEKALQLTSGDPEVELQ